MFNDNQFLLTLTTKQLEMQIIQVFQIHRIAAFVVQITMLGMEFKKLK